MEQEPERHKALVYIAALSIPSGLLSGLLVLIMAWPVFQIFDPWILVGRSCAHVFPGQVARCFFKGGILVRLGDPRGYLPGAWVPWWRDTVRYFASLPEHFFSFWLPRAIIPRFWTLPNEHQEVPPLLVVVFLATVTGLLIGLLVDHFRPWETRFKDLGDAKWASMRDLKRDELFGKTGLILGRWDNALIGLLPSRHPLARKLRNLVFTLVGTLYIRNWEVLSGQLLAPPGTGKSVIIATNILADWPRDAAIPPPSWICNDPKGELYATLAGWCSRQGPIIKLAWAEIGHELHSWNPLDPSNVRGGEERLGLRQEIRNELVDLFGEAAGASALFGLLNLAKVPGWEPKIRQDWRVIFTEADVAPPQAGADAGPRVAALEHRIIRLHQIEAAWETHVDGLCAAFIPDTVEVHWRNTGRSALSAAILFASDRKATFPDAQGNIPSMGYILELFAGVAKDPTTGWRSLVHTDPSKGEDGEVTDAGKTFAPDNVGTADTPTGGDANPDKLAAMLEEWIGECKRYGYSPRAQQELAELQAKPDRERGSVISTAMGSISIFRNAAVRARTSSCTFRMEDLRGWVDPDSGILRPVSTFLVIPVAEANSLGRVTGAFLDTVTAWNLSYTDAELRRLKKRNRPIKGGRHDFGILPLYIVADEFWTLPPLQRLTQIPALGRGYWLGLLIAGQSSAQIVRKYGNEGTAVKNELENSMHYKMYPAQKAMEDCKSVSEAVGNTTYVSISTSTQHGLGKNVNPFSWGHNKSKQAQPLIRPEQVGRLEKLDPRKGRWGQLIVRFDVHSIKARPAVYFDDPRLASRADLPLETRFVIQRGHNHKPAPVNSGGKRPGLQSSLLAAFRRSA